MAIKVFKEKQFGNGRGTSSWAPSVVLEGRVARKIGSLTVDGDAEPQYLQMFVYDAVFGSQGNGIMQDPLIAMGSQGHRIVLPHGTTAPERQRVARLYDQFYLYIRDKHKYVRECITAAEEMQNMDAESLKHYSLLIEGRRDHARRQQGHAVRLPFACNAGHHGRPNKVSEVCLLVPQTVARNERCALAVNLRGQGLQEIQTDHRAFDAVYHVLLNPNGYEGWEHGLPLRSSMDAFLSLPAHVRRPNTQSRRIGSSAMNPRSNITMLDYYAYQLHFKQGPVVSANCLFMSARLFQEYACVAFWRIENARLLFHKLDQEKNDHIARVQELQNFAQQVRGGGNR